MSPFSFGKSNVDVLEAKFNIYEDLSRQMLNKLEIAVDKISEANSNVANILIKHDERIGQTIKNDQIFIKEIEEMKRDNKEDHEKVYIRIDKLESKMDDLIKFRWIAVGAVIIISFLFSMGMNNSSVIDIVIPNAKTERNK
jgi:hypothetical protein